MCQCGCRQLNLNLDLTNIFERRRTHAWGMGGLLGPFPVCCQPILFCFSLPCAGLCVPWPKSRCDDSRSSETPWLGALIWSNECVCVIWVWFCGLMTTLCSLRVCGRYCATHGDGRGKLNGNRMTLTLSGDSTKGPGAGPVPPLARGCRTAGRQRPQAEGLEGAFPLRSWRVNIVIACIYF